MKIISTVAVVVSLFSVVACSSASAPDQQDGVIVKKMTSDEVAQFVKAYQEDPNCPKTYRNPTGDCDIGLPDADGNYNVMFQIPPCTVTCPVINPWVGSCVDQ